MSKGTERTECRLNGRVIGIDDALAIRKRKGDVVFSCVKCGERVRAHSRGSTTQAAHFEHFAANPNCPWSGRA